MINWNPIPDINDPAIQIHAMTGAITAFGTHYLTDKWLVILLAVSVVTGVKELWAYLNPHKYQVSFSHAVATCIGGLAASAVIRLMF